MKIIVDAMGGDNAPEAIVKGAVLARDRLGVELCLELLKEGKGIRHGTCKACQHLAMMQLADFPRRGLHDSALAEGHLAVTGDGYLAIFLDCNDCRCVKLIFHI